MTVLLHLFIGFKNCFVHISNGENLSLSFFENVLLKDFKNYDFIYISCLDGKDSFLIKRNNKLLNYLKFCLKSQGEFKEQIFKIEFYKEFINAKDKLALNKLADKLFYKNYSYFFHYYDIKKVEFYRSILRYKLAKIYYNENSFSKALKIVSDLERNENFRIRFLARNLKSEIYNKLNYKFEGYEIKLDLSDGIYIKGLDTTLNFENLRIYKLPMICELDFPEVYIVKNKKLILWYSPIAD